MYGMILYVYIYIYLFISEYKQLIIIKFKL